MNEFHSICFLNRESIDRDRLLCLPSEIRATCATINQSMRTLCTSMYFLELRIVFVFVRLLMRMLHSTSITQTTPAIVGNSWLKSYLALTGGRAAGGAVVTGSPAAFHFMIPPSNS